MHVCVKTSWRIHVCDAHDCSSLASSRAGDASRTKACMSLHPYLYMRVALIKRADHIHAFVCRHTS